MMRMPVCVCHFPISLIIMISIKQAGYWWNDEIILVYDRRVRREMCQLSNFGCYTPDEDMVVMLGRMSGPDLTSKLIILSSSPQHLGPGMAGSFP